ncbi:aminoglycoside phosphotransferase family protein [Riemerella columbina]|uniref:aminoglycoside phosphotransferase family protein n=1 Tax=Riemerella columbina TaxID=103810 RepID=UPI00266EC919|nr:phosphotransferase [Riemerella columbina]WKS94874.1 aminoglycoside phosphotransferase family protein [Riemerella columbina]
MREETAQHFFESHFKSKVQNWLKLPASGSSRVNFVATSESGEKYIVTSNQNRLENEAFIYFSQIFSNLNLNTPEIIAISDDDLSYIQTYLGQQTLSEIIAEEGESSRVKALVKQTLYQLYQLQTKTKGKIDYSKTFEYEAYNEFPITNDFYYFKNFVADVLELHYHKYKLLKEFKTLTEKIESLQPKGLMIRDFQARNIMVNDENQVFFIDYQAAMQGPLMYDVISFLYQAKANFSTDFKNEMLDYYYALFEDEKQVAQLKESLPYLQLIRFLQVLGAYGFRGLIQRKPHFLESLPKGIDNLYQFSKTWSEIQNYPELNQLILQLKQYDIANL